MSFWHESRLSLRLAVPLMIGQLSQMLMGVVDTLMVGKLGVTELAALTFANSLFHVPFVFGIGLLSAVSVFSSNARGADDPAKARSSCLDGLWMSLSFGLILFGVAWLVSMRLEWFRQPPEVVASMVVYFRILMASMVPALASIALKNHADAMNRPWPPFWIFLGGVLLNVFLNWLLIFGNLGFPKMGFEGAAWATLMARTAILVAMLVWLKHAGFNDWVPASWLRWGTWAGMKKLMTIGAPASLQMLSEVGAFSLTGLIMGRFGREAMAAHQIAITLAGVSFMVPLGLSMALTVRVGEAHGAGESQRLSPIVRSGWFLLLVYGLVAAAGFLFFGRAMALAFTPSEEVVGIAVSMLMIVGIFQVFDGLQVGSSSMLRGLHDARVPALIGFVAYWVAGLPVAAWLAFPLGLGAPGVWWGLAAGLFVACGTLGPRLWLRVRRDSSSA
jgi:MATE family multidrug resistance protein